MNGRQHSNGEERRGTHSQQRPSFSSVRTGSTSTTLTSDLIVEQNNTEPYAGATFETVPSSIVSFHHPHSFQSSSIARGSVASNSGADERGRRLTEEDSLIYSPSQRSRSSSHNPHFRFFTEEQISSAEGASTLERADYDTIWDSVPVYEQQAHHDSRLGSQRSSIHSRSSRSSNLNGNLYGSASQERGRSLSRGSRNGSDHEVEEYSSSLHSSSSLQYSIRDRIPAELEENGTESLDDRSSVNSGESSRSIGDTSDHLDNGQGQEDSHTNHKNSSTHAEYLKSSYHEKFYSDYIPHQYYQRFYIAEEDLVIGIGGYRTSRIRAFLYNTLCITTLGLFYLLMRWMPYYKMKLCGIRVPLAKAEKVVIESEFGEYCCIDVKRCWYNRPMSTLLPITPSRMAERCNRDMPNNLHRTDDENPSIPILISFEYRYITFIYSPVEDIFKTNNNWVDPDWVHLGSVTRGLSRNVWEDRVIAFGKNHINLNVKTVSQILFDEVLHPFYVFQIFSIILWSLDEYYYYAACIFLISLLSVIDSLLETKKTSRRLAAISYFNCEVRVFRKEFWTHVSSTELVPGDIYEVSDPALTIFPCDSILLSGDCIVNESMLTGESVPVSKVPANQRSMHQLIEDFQNTQISSYVSKSFLFSGTKMIRTRIPHGQTAALAMAVRTGFSTTKGSLVRSMAFPKPASFKFYEDSFRYIGFMGLIALLGFSVSCFRFIQLGLDKKTMILRALDIITIVVPPALPATLTIGTSFALARLKKKGIFCISPTRVNVCGKIDVMCFDKTGTLTEDDLDIYGVHLSEPVSYNKFKFSKLHSDIKSVFPKFSLNDCNSPLDFRSKNFLISMLTCHSLRLVDDELLGDPLDFKMFQFTGWSYDEDFQRHAFHSMYDQRHEGDIFPENFGIMPAVVHPNGNDSNNRFTDNDPHNLLGIVRSFEFLSELRRMSVIVKPSSNDVYWAFSKGAPEVIASICAQATLPQDYDEILRHYTHTGYRVIACAGKTLPKRTWLYSQKVSREEIESNMEFLGFIIFENKLKEASKSTLATLREANIRTIMCTGDNVLTAISVGRESKLIQFDRVYVPYIDDGPRLHESVIFWRDVDNCENILDCRTLKPSDSIEDYTLAVTGDVFRLLFREESAIPDTYKDEVLLKASIYARMSPDEKHELMEQLQKLDYVVGFCGDGANDCGALKAANVGISLSEAEASVAAPFTSQVFDISCVLDIIKEGRASLVTSFACFQYMSLYSAIQFITVTILYCRGSNLGDFQFLYIDLLLIVPIAICMSWSKPYYKLSKKRPSANLVSPKILVPLVVSILVCLVFQLVPWLLVQGKPWYIKPVIGGDDVVQSSENTVLFFVSNFQYILTAVVLSIGPPYRQPMHKNKEFVIDIIFSILLSSLLMFINPRSFCGKLLQLTKTSKAFKIFIICWACINYYCQLYIPNYMKQYFKKRNSSKKYKNILRQQDLSTV
ncbi:hypothetical protein HG535_0F01110 [Zygotorulaspora mrakii]|uniref:Cation-transporting ATPase n=1 Tax=Zygotorulaspora mrakii TaxID=42260 RepID=A0A7H9B4I8_ZYGMR|nr:uncharacterized protein HG535_0F01110 [Zygotorulaspora mrakii]QLG73601.1 hypothetical protein HG535_0F01110 [Zygotorulaspora mrakii]